MAQVIAVDVGGTNLRVALVEGKKILKLIKRKTPRDNFVEELIKEISKLINSNVRGIGIGTPGFFDKGKFVNSPNLKIPGNLIKIVERKFKKKVFVENDGNCVALAELKYGVKKKNFLVLTIGTGIGGGIVIDGKMYKGMGFAGEVGRMIINEGKDLEFFSGVNGLKRFGGEKRAEYLGKGIANLINIFDPEVVVLSGGARYEGNKLLSKIKSEVKKYSLRKNVPIVWSKIREPGVIGAGLLIR